MSRPSGISIVTPAHSPQAAFLHHCPVCGADHLRRLAAPSRWIGRDVFAHGQGLFALSRCRPCGLVFVNPRPTSIDLQRFYNNAGYACHSRNDSPEAHAATRVILDLIQRYTPHKINDRLLDFGCGGGHLLRACHSAGWDALGYDLSPRAIAACRAQGLPAHSDLDALPRGSFAAIVLNHVFEHIENPRATLQLLRRLLAPGGRLFIEVPNADSLRARLSRRFLSDNLGADERYQAFPIHLSYYNRRNLPQLLRQEGLHVVGIETFGIGVDEFFTTGAVLSPAAGSKVPKDPAPPTPLLRLAKRAIKATLFGLKLGENMMVISQP